MANKLDEAYRVLNGLIKKSGASRAHKKGFSARELQLLHGDRYNDQWKYKRGVGNVDEGLVTGSDSHSYYDGHDYNKVLLEDDYRKMFPVAQKNPETGKEFVEFFHWTNPANVDKILETGLAANLGPDAGRWQKRAGVWTSYGDKNPMSYDYVNKKTLGEEGFSQVPLKIRIPREVYEGMRVDHTGKTFDDQVAVFRAPKDKKYGTVSIKGLDGRKKTLDIAIPPEYIGRYDLPDWWMMDGSSRTREGTNLPVYGSTLPGWKPGMGIPPYTMNFEDMYRKIVPEEERINGYNVEKVNEQRVKQLSSMLKSNPESFKEKLADDRFKPVNFKEQARKRVEDSKRIYDDAIRLGADPNATEPPVTFGKAVKQTEERLNPLMRGMAAAQAFINDDKEMETPFDVGKRIKDFGNIRQPEGHVINGSRKLYNREDFYSPIELGESREAFKESFPRTYSKFLERYDETPLRMFDFSGLTLWADGRVPKNLRHNDIASRMGWLVPDGYQYAKEAGINLDDLQRYRNEKYDKAYEYNLGEPVNPIGLDQVNHRRIVQENEFAKNHGSYYSPVSTYKKRRDNRMEEDFDTDELVRQFKNKFSADSLDRVIGHQIGRKIGKYRSERLRYGLDREKVK